MSNFGTVMMVVVWHGMVQYLSLAYLPELVQYEVSLNPSIPVDVQLS